MHILFLPSFYPEESMPLNGSFFKSQTKMLLGRLEQSATIYVEQKSLKQIFNQPHQNRYQKSIDHEVGILTYRQHGLNLLNQYEFGAKIWISLTMKMVHEYIRKNGKPDLIHAHNVFHAGRVAKKCVEMYQIPYVVTEHASGFLLNEYSPKQLKIAKKVYQHASKVLAVSFGLAKKIQELCAIDLPTVVPNVVNTQIFSLHEQIEKQPSFTFISVGNLLQNKGHHILITAFGEFKKRTNQAVQLHIYGKGTEQQNLEKLIIKLNLSEDVFLKGILTSNELSKAYQQANCLVLPSFKETFGVVLIEAMACGLPVIATKSGGPEDLVHEYNGLIVDAGDTVQMADALEKMLLTYSNYNSKNISKEIENNFSEPVIADRLIAIYKIALTSRLGYAVK